MSDETTNAPGHVEPAPPPPRKPPVSPWSHTGLAVHGACTMAVIAGLLAGVWWPVVAAFVIESIVYVARGAK
jgi:hypothetical protein